MTRANNLIGKSFSSFIIGKTIDSASMNHIPILEKTTNTI